MFFTLSQLRKIIIACLVKNLYFGTLKYLFPAKNPKPLTIQLCAGHSLPVCKVHYVKDSHECPRTGGKFKFVLKS